MVARHSHRKVATPHRLKRMKQFLRRIRRSVGKGLGFCSAASGRWCGWTEVAHVFPLRSNPSVCVIETAADSQIKWEKPATTSAPVPQVQAGVDKSRKGHLFRAPPKKAALLTSGIWHQRRQITELGGMASDHGAPIVDLSASTAGDCRTHAAAASARDRAVAEHA
jgi:hypothetical protein